MDDQAVRTLLELHWAASDAGDFAAEHAIYREDAVLDYPQSGERLRGRRNILKAGACSRTRSVFWSGGLSGAAISGSRS